MYTYTEKTGRTGDCWHNNYCARPLSPPSRSTGEIKYSWKQGGSLGKKIPPNTTSFSFDFVHIHIMSDMNITVVTLQFCKLIY